MYIIICDMLVSFSLVMNVCFITASALLFLLHKVINDDNYTKYEEPSFYRIFIKVSTSLYFAFILSLVLFNVLYPKNQLSDDSKYDYIIVFGAGVSEGKNEIMNSRLEVAVKYAKQYPHCKFVLTGAKGNDEPIIEALYMRNYMVERNVKDHNIIVEPFSVNTNENLYKSLSLILEDVIRRNSRENIITRPFKRKPDSFDINFLNIGFMSSEFHLTRINLMAKKMGVLKPYDIKCDTKTIYKPYFYIREDLSLLKAFVLNQLKF